MWSEVQMWSVWHPHVEFCLKVKYLLYAWGVRSEYGGCNTSWQHGVARRVWPEVEESFQHHIEFWYTDEAVPRRRVHWIRHTVRSPKWSGKSATHIAWSGFKPGGWCWHSCTTQGWSRPCRQLVVLCEPIVPKFTFVHVSLASLLLVLCFASWGNLCVSFPCVSARPHPALLSRNSLLLR